ncbi:MFS transporter [Maridesulfovibrio frigidus]|uniref:MFS transporter n=1 Tax=Maridesulfovibrio frigidus TaxID=340956 RepID=UPI0004E15DB9|nr:MFS transporter [Maridesulfovibrio frigidus]
MTTKSQISHPLMPWAVWAIATLYFFYDYMQQVAPSAMEPQLAAHFHADAASMGLISSVYFYSYALMQIPIGIMADRFGPHRPLAIAAIVSTCAGAFFTFTTTPAEAIGVRIMLGAATGFSFVSCLKLVSNWFPPEKFATMVGLTNIIGMVGAVMGEAPLTRAVAVSGWHGTILGIAAFGGIVALLIIFLVKDHPPVIIQKHTLADRGSGLAEALTALKTIASNPHAWLNASYAATINMIYTGFGALWGTSFIAKLYGISSTNAAIVVSMLFVGAIPGSFFFGWFSDKLGKRSLPMIIAASGGLICVSAVVYLPGIPMQLMYGLMFLLGFFCSGNVVAYAYGNDISPKGANGISLGFVNTFLIGGSALAQPIIGWMLVASSHGAKEFTLPDFRYSLSILVAAKAVALIAALTIGRTKSA